MATKVMWKKVVLILSMIMLATAFYVGPEYFSQIGNIFYFVFVMYFWLFAMILNS